MPPGWGHCGSTARILDAPTTQVAYIHPSASTAHTASAGACTLRVMTAFPSEVLDVPRVCGSVGSSAMFRPFTGCYLLLHA